MKGALRLAIAAWTGGLLLASPLHARAAPPPESPPPQSPPPATDSVGPRELQNFSLQGNVTRPADQPVAQPAPRTTARSTAPTVQAAREPARRPVQTASATARPPTTGAAQVKSDFQPTAPASPPPTAPTPASASPEPPAIAPAHETASPTLEPTHRLLIWPWLLAAAALGAAGAFLFLRNRSNRAALAGGPQLDLFTAPEPAPPPAPPPVPQPRAPVPPSGIVSTNLRPQLEVNVQPLRCIVTQDDVTIEFELELFNSGNGPARSIHVAAALINAGEGQDQQLAGFFGQPAGPGERIDVIQPLQRVAFATRIATPLAQIRALEVGGRQVFVPILAFNAHYGSGSKAALTSVGYLVGREGKGEKLAPFRLDLGPRLFRGLGARALPTGVRR